MRRDQHIRRVPQRVVRRQRLRVGDVQGGPRDLLGLERLDQSRLIDDLPARDVRNVRAGRIGLVQDCEFRPGEEVRGLLAGFHVSVSAHHVRKQG